MLQTKPWQFWIDRGGTFTDVVARSPDGPVHTAKLLSEDPTRREDAAIAAIRQLTGVASGSLPPCQVRMGTTVATNALLERKGQPTLLVTTRGVRDMLELGYQHRCHGRAQDSRNRSGVQQADLRASLGARQPTTRRRTIGTRTRDPGRGSGAAGAGSGR